MSTKPLNRRVKISNGGLAYVETADLVASRLKRIGAAMTTDSTPSERALECATEVCDNVFGGNTEYQAGIASIIDRCLTVEREEQKELDAQRLDKLAEVYDDQSRELECDAVMKAAARIRNQKEGQQ